MDRLLLGRRLPLAAQTSALVFFILIGAMIFARFLVPTGLPGEFVEVVNEANIPTLLIVIPFLIMYVSLGMFQDSISRTPYQ